MTIYVLGCKHFYEFLFYLDSLTELKSISLVSGIARKDGIFYLTFAALFGLHLVGSLLPQML